jgi:hypothetical protein
MSPSPNDELMSWKEIATYLGIAVRTAQLWERERNLPVRRLPGGRGRVSANIAELERWKGSIPPEVHAPPDDAAAGASTEAPPAGPPLAAPASPATKRGSVRRLLVGCFLAAAVLLTTVAARTWRRSPAIARVEKDTLLVFDANGNELWRKTFPHPLGETGNPERASLSLWVGDLDDDGQSEVLFSPHTLPESPRSSPLVCYDSHGRVRWEYRNERRVRTADGPFSTIHNIAGFLVARLDKGRTNAVFVTTTHQFYYPSQAALLTPDGRTHREYWHSGHLNHLQVADLNGDQKPEFYAAGINNARHAVTMVVLDENHFAGAAAEPAFPHHQLLDFDPGVELARILVPQSCLSRETDPYNTVASFEVGSDEIVLQTSEKIGAGAGIFHHLSPDLRTRQVSLSDSFTIEHRRRIRAGGLTEASCPVEPVPGIEAVTR